MIESGTIYTILMSLVVTNGLVQEPIHDKVKRSWNSWFPKMGDTGFGRIMMGLTSGGLTIVLAMLIAAFVLAVFGAPVVT